MAVEQHFTFPLPITTLGEIEAGDEMVQVTLDRHAAAVLHSELGDALGHTPSYLDNSGVAVPASFGVYMPHDDMEDDMPEDDMVDAGMPFQGGAAAGPTRQLTVEQIQKNMERQLAAEQVASRRGQSVVDGLNRGSGIGSGQR